MGKYLGATGLTYLWGKFKSIFATKTEVAEKADIGNVLFPNFDDMTPVKVIEFDVASTSYYQLFTRTNTGLSSTMTELNDYVLFRITVTGSNIYNVTDVSVRFSPRIIYPIVMAFNMPYSVSATTTGFQFLRCCYPKTKNSGYGWIFDFNPYNATSRHFKIEVFATTENVTWITGATSTTYNSTYHNLASMTVYTKYGFLYMGTPPINAETSDSTVYVNGYYNKYLANNVMKAGEALVSHNIVFGNAGYMWKISNKLHSIDPAYGIVSIGSNISANSSIGYIAIRTRWNVTYQTDANLTWDTFSVGDTMYLRCIMKDGKIYSDGHLAKEMSPGYTWYLLGAMSSATSLSLNTDSSYFITLDDVGMISHIDGKPMQSTLLNGSDNVESTMISTKDSKITNVGEVNSILGRSIVWNEVLTNGNFADSTDWRTSNISMSVSNNKANCVRTGNSPQLLKYTNTYNAHKYYVSLYYQCNELQSGELKVVFYRRDATAGSGGESVFPISSTRTRHSVIMTPNKDCQDFIIYLPDVDGAICDIDNVCIIDITKMFGAGYEPATASAFEEMFPLDYYNNNTGTLLSVLTTGVKSVDAGNNDVDTASISLTTLTGKATGSDTSVIMFPDGLKSIGNVRDEINFSTGKAYKRIGSVNLGTLSWGRTSSSGIYYLFCNETAPKPDGCIIPSSGSDPKRQALLCAKYAPTSTLTGAVSTTLAIDKTMVMRTQGTLAIRDDSYTNANTFKSDMNGVILHYELATPVEYTLNDIPDTSYYTKKSGKEMWLPVNDATPTTAPVEGIVKYGVNIVQKIIDLEAQIQQLAQTIGN